MPVHTKDDNFNDNNKDSSKKCSKHEKQYSWNHFCKVFFFSANEQQKELEHLKQQKTKLRINRNVIVRWYGR